jgi:formylmethanofuran dehydrogenase subunit E
MGCTIDKETIEKTIAFHGHTCPGLAIGIRLSELAIQKLEIHNAKKPVCVAETDMCALDAVQFLTGCSFGKGNLIHKDYGKSGFTFFDRDAEKGFRALFQENFRNNDPDRATLGKLMGKITAGTATAAEQEQCKALRESAITRIMDADLEELFSVQEVSTPPVRPAQILESIKCDACGEMTMESRIRRYGGQYMCIPCFMQHEQKI